MKRKTRTIKVDLLARVEGEGALWIDFRNGEADVRLKIFEPPRFFEAFLVGRRFDEVPDITARICGICPIAYQMSSSTAMENAFGVKVGGMLRELRRLIYCGEWIESHALHVHLLHAPDFLGFEDAIQMAAAEADAVRRGLRLKEIGNSIMSLVGGRAVHPINLRVGGFYSVPSRQDVLDLMPDLQSGLDEAEHSARWVAGFEFPDFSPKTDFVAMRHPDEYPLFDGRLAGSDGLDIALDEFETAFAEDQAPHSHALHCLRKDRGCYQVGPIARLNLNRELLSPRAAALARQLLPEDPVVNPFRSIVVRAVETVFAFEEAIRIAEEYEPPSVPSVRFEPRAGTAVGCSEAPRGICWHRYAVGEDGLVKEAKIVPPTSQNQARIEQDLRELLPGIRDLDDERLKWLCEQAIRNYDPCISCATHCLTVEVVR